MDIKDKAKEDYKKTLVKPQPTANQTYSTKLVEVNKLSTVLSEIESHRYGPLIKMAIPKIKNLCEDILITSIRMIFQGTSESGNHNTYNINSSSMTKYATIRNQTRESYSKHKTYEYDSVLFHTRGDAEAALYDLKQKLKENGIVTVADWFDICGQRHDYTANDWGWTSLITCRIKTAYNGWVVIFPSALPIA